MPELWYKDVGNPDRIRKRGVKMVEVTIKAIILFVFVLMALFIRGADGGDDDLD